MSDVATISEPIPDLPTFIVESDKVSNSKYSTSHIKYFKKNRADIIIKMKAYYEANKERIKANKREKYAKDKLARVAA